MSKLKSLRLDPFISTRTFLVAPRSHTLHEMRTVSVLDANLHDNPCRFRSGDGKRRHKRNSNWNIFRALADGMYIHHRLVQCQCQIPNYGFSTIIKIMCVDTGLLIPIMLPVILTSFDSRSVSFRGNCTNDCTEHVPKPF